MPVFNSCFLKCFVMVLRLKGQFQKIFTLRWRRDTEGTIGKRGREKEEESDQLQYNTGA